VVERLKGFYFSVGDETLRSAVNTLNLILQSSTRSILFSAEEEEPDCGDEEKLAGEFGFSPILSDPCNLTQYIIGCVYAPLVPDFIKQQSIESLFLSIFSQGSTNAQIPYFLRGKNAE
jgi:hypothetical protein